MNKKLTAKGGNKSQKRNQSTEAIPRLVLGGRLMFGFPSKLLTKVRYVDTMPLLSSVGSIGKQVFRLNSTFDPDVTNVGHQPLYRDTYAAIYDQYAVVSTRCIVTIVNVGNVPIHCGCVVEDDASSSASYTTLMEQSTGQHKLLPALSGSLSTHTWTYEWDCQRDLGIDPISSETYKTAVGSNPTEEADFLVWAQPVDLSTTVNNYINVELEMTVLWSELTTPTGS